MVWFQRLCDYFCLGILWIIASLPIVTFGAATTAMLQTAEFSIRKEGGKIWQPFWSSFGKEFKQSTLLWLIQIPLLVILAFNFWVIYSKQMTPLFRLFVGLASILEFSWLQLWFCYQSKFTDNVKTVLVNTVRLTLGNLGRAFLMSALTVAALVAAFFLFFLLTPAMLFVPGIYIIFYTALFRGLVRRSFSEDDDGEELATVRE